MVKVSQDGWVEAFAPAKINLALHVTGQRPDGYHLLDSLVVFANIGDRVRVRPASQQSLRVIGPMAQGVPADARNLVWKAAEWFGTPPVEIELIKNLPPASGIGGGSSDAAATLRALAKLFDKPLPEPTETVPLGADVPVCLRPGNWWMGGIGDCLSGAPDLPEYLGLVLINPGVEIPTPTIFNALVSKQNPPISNREFEGLGEFSEWLLTHRNDLEPAAIDLAPIVAEVLDVLRREDPICARMSGSGATCFAVFPTRHEAKVAAGRIAEQNPKWWVQWASFYSDPE